MISHSWQLESGWCVLMKKPPGGDGTVSPAHGTLSPLELLLLRASRPYPSLWGPCSLLKPNQTGGPVIQKHLHADSWKPGSWIFPVFFPSFTVWMCHSEPDSQGVKKGLGSSRSHLQ